MVEIIMISTNTMCNWLKIEQHVSILDIRPIAEINIPAALKSQLVSVA